MTQSSFTFTAPEPQAPIATAEVQRVSAPVIRQRAEAHPFVLALLAKGELDFLDVKHLPPGVKEAKTARKKPAGGRPSWLPLGME